MLFQTSVIGSLPRPAFVRDLLSLKDSLSSSTYNERLENVIRFAIALQETAGIDVVSDGEWRRISYLGVITELANGFTVEPHPLPGRPLMITVTDTIRPKSTDFLAKEATFTRSITKGKLKVALPSPGLLGERMWNPERSRDAYPTRESFVEACVPILRRSLELLIKAGVDIVQIDDPHLCLLVDEHVRSSYLNPEAAAEFDVAMINRLIEGISAYTSVHLCRRAGARSRGDLHFKGPYEWLIPFLNKLNVRQLAMEFTPEGSGDASVLSTLRQDFDIALGCLSVHHGLIDAPELILDRAKEALKYIDTRRLSLTPDCGFAPSATAIVSLDEVYEKLCNLSIAAKQLRSMYT